MEIAPDYATTYRRWFATLPDDERKRLAALGLDQPADDRPFIPSDGRRSFVPVDNLRSLMTDTPTDDDADPRRKALELLARAFHAASDTTDSPTRLAVRLWAIVAAGDRSLLPKGMRRQTDAARALGVSKQFIHQEVITARRIYREDLAPMLTGPSERG